jgi:hypothetical protein
VIVIANVGVLGNYNLPPFLNEWYLKISLNECYPRGEDISS